jgi:hypothetical protein
MKRLCILASVAFCVASAPAFAANWTPPTTEVPKDDAAYIAKVKTAAPPSVVNNATIVRTPKESTKVLQTGSNGYTCFLGGDGTPECDDQNAMEWRKAMWAKQTPPNKIGFIFMLAGDSTGINNHDSSVTEKTEHWIPPTGPHVMLVGGATREMLSQYPRDETVKDQTAPFIMFPGKPNEHVMIPVHMEPLR